MHDNFWNIDQFLPFNIFDAKFFVVVVEVDNVQSIQDFKLWEARNLVDFIISEPVLTKFSVRLFTYHLITTTIDGVLVALTLRMEIV